MDFGIHPKGMIDYLKGYFVIVNLCKIFAILKIFGRPEVNPCWFRCKSYSDLFIKR